MPLFSWHKNPKNPYKDYSFLGVDLHSHLLPGIDDGSKSVEESLAMIEALLSLGFSSIITTPHILPGYYMNTALGIRKACEKLMGFVNRAGLGVEIQVAAEYYTDRHFMDLIKRNEILTLPENYLLFELPVVEAPRDLHSYIFEMQSRGYKPLLAHPERYVYAQRKKEFLSGLRELDVAFQLNLMSLVGIYGPGPKTLASDLLNKGWYEFAASDLHQPIQIKALREALHALPPYTFLNRKLQIDTQN